MPTFNGKPVFRGQGKAQDGQLQEWDKTARRAITQGGRIYQSQTGDMHIVSPSGAHWGTFNSLPQKFEGGSLQKFSPDNESTDITYKYQ